MTITLLVGWKAERVSSGDSPTRPSTLRQRAIGPRRREAIGGRVLGAHYSTNGRAVDANGGNQATSGRVASCVYTSCRREVVPGWNDIEPAFCSIWRVTRHGSQASSRSRGEGSDHKLGLRPYSDKG